MDEKPHKIWRRFRIGICCALVLAAGAGAVMWSGGADAGPGRSGPDVTVLYLTSVANNGVSGGVRGYSVGTTSCNIGNEPLWWCNDAGDTFCETNQHPVIAQNLYRLKDGRFEQLGMSWLKHGFFSVNSTDSTCGSSCQSPPHGGDQLGVGCTDPYGSGLNGSRPLGMRSEVNGATGEFPYPYTTVGHSGVNQWIQVKESELDPAQNAGARYWVEGHYIAADDAEAGNSLNNASHREVLVSGSNFNLQVTGPTIWQEPAITAWQAVDPTVQLMNLDVPTPFGGEAGSIIERFHVARKVTETAGGFHYEYAVHNLNSDRSAYRFRLEFPVNTVISNAGFRDVPHHSGEPYDANDWVIGIDQAAGTVTWETDDHATNANANALRWGTMFTFWVDAEESVRAHRLEFFKPGTPAGVYFTFGGGSEPIFVDDFESGNANSWSDVFP